MTTKQRHRLRLEVLPQPDNVTCGPTCLQAVYRYYGDVISLEQVIEEVTALPHGGTLAVLLKLEFVLIFVGGVFVLEALSVIIQVASFKLRGKRVFKMSPIHHHFELSGWPEEKIVMRFYILGILCALVAASTLKIR